MSWGDVLDDPAQVAGVDAAAHCVGEGAGVVLCLEDGDAGEDGICGPGCDGDPQALVGVVEAETLEGCVQGAPNDGVLASCVGLLGPLLLADALGRRGPGALDLLGGGSVLPIEFDPAASPSVGPGPVVGGAQCNMGW